MTTKRKIIAIVTAFSVWASTAAPALALTAAELQAQIDALMSQLATLQAQLSALEGGETATTVCTITSFTRNLKQGMSGDDVKCLQIVLNLSADTKLADSGAGSPGNETSYFGPITKAAVIKFQEKYASEVLASWGLTSGTGFVGSTTRAKLDTFLTDGGVTPPVDGEVGTAATVSLASDTPVAAQVALNSQDVIFTKIKFTAGANAYTVTKIVVARGGVSADADVASIKLYDGSTQLGSTQALNTNTHKATFSSLSWTVPSYGVKYLTIKASIAASGTATVGDSIQLGIASAADLVSSVTPSAVYPIMGNARTIAGISVGGLNVDAQTSPATTTILSGATDQEIACWRFTASSTEGFSVHKIKISQVGTAASTDLSNIKLKIAGSQIGPTIAALDSSNQAEFDLSSAPLSIVMGGSKDICAYTDISAGIWTGRTVIYEITQYLDVTAYGSNSGGVTTIGSDTNEAFSRQRGSQMTVGQGSLTVALDASLNPAQQYYVKGTTNRLMTAVKFSTGASEGVRIVKLRFTLTGAVTDIANITLWDDATQIAGPSSAIGGYVNFGANTIGWDATGLFDMEKSTNKTILVKADIPTGASSTAQIRLAVASPADVWADGLESQYDIPSGSISGSATGNAHYVSGFGSLVVSLASDTPAAQAYVKGSTAKVFAKINLTAGSGEDVILSAITFRCYRSDSTGSTCSSGDLTNAKLLKSDGTQFGVTIASPAATLAFSGNLTITAAQAVSLSLVADVPTSSSATTTHVSIDETGSTVATDLTTTGASSGVDISESGSAIGKLMTLGQGSLTVSAAATPGDQTLIIGATQAPVVNLVFTAGTGEDVRITRILLRRMCLTGANNCAAGDATNIALYEGSTILTVKKPWDTSNTTNTTITASDFLNNSGIDITKGQQKTITVAVDLPSTGTAGNDFSIGIATSTDPDSTTSTDVTFVGLQSNTTPDPTVIRTTTNLEGANWSSRGHEDGYFVSLLDAGILTIAASADTPVAAIQSVSVEGVKIPNVAFLKVYLKASLEQIDVKSISIERIGEENSRDSDFDSITLYDGAGNVLAGPQALSNASSTFNFVPGSYWRIPTVGVQYLIVKATLNGIRSYYGYGSETGDNPKLCIDTVTAEGVDSGSTSITGITSPLDICSNNQMIRMTKPTLALASPGTGSYGAGTKELIRWTVTADATGDVKWKKIIFDMSGTVSVGTTGYTVGSYPDGCNGSVVANDSVYMSTSTTCGGALATQLIATSSMQVWDADTNTQIDATTTATGLFVDQRTATGTARIAFVAATEQTVGAGRTKTYYLQGTILQGGTAGDNLLTKIVARSTATTTGTFATLGAESASGTFIWSDGSGASAGAHSASSADWTHDYKVPGIPTASWTLSK